MTDQWIIQPERATTTSEPLAKQNILQWFWTIFTYYWKWTLHSILKCRIHKRSVRRKMTWKVQIPILEKLRLFENPTRSSADVDPLQYEPPTPKSEHYWRGLSISGCQPRENSTERKLKIAKLIARNFEEADEELYVRSGSRIWENKVKLQRRTFLFIQVHRVR